MGNLGAEKGLAVIVGANKGIGLGLCEAFKSAGYTIIATCRTASPELEKLQVQIVTGVDVSQPDGVEPLVTAVKNSNRKLELLVVAAGYQQLDGLDNLDFEDLDKHWQVNAVGPLRVVAALKDHLQPNSAKVVLLSSKMGSQGAADIAPGGGLYGYRMSKTALNMAGKLLAEDLAQLNIPVAVVHPGPVDTGMLRSLRKARGITEEEKLSAGTITVQRSAASICEYVVARLNMSNSGDYWAADSNSILPW